MDTHYITYCSSTFTDSSPSTHKRNSGKIGTHLKSTHKCKLHWSVWNPNNRKNVNVQSSIDITIEFFLPTAPPKNGSWQMKNSRCENYPSQSYVTYIHYINVAISLWTHCSCTNPEIPLRPTRGIEAKLGAKMARKRRLLIPKARDLELSRECGSDGPSSWRKVACCNGSKQFMLMASEGETPVLVAWHRGTGDMADLGRFTRIWVVP